MWKTPNHAFSMCKKQTSHALCVPVTLFLAGCEGIQSTLSPHGPAAQAISNISWVMFIGAALILLLVMTLALYAVYRAPDKRRPISGNMLIAAGGVAFPVITLSALLIYGVIEMRYLRAESDDAPVDIDVVGNQWWWDVHYRNGDGSQVITTANEIHIPAGVPVKIAVRTRDVIHSFWVPNLAGKIDLIPGRTNHVVLQADQPGIFRGQCAEFCGAQHARMAFIVVAEPADAYQAWLANQRQPAAAPSNDTVLRGRDAFMASGCMNCHTVRGVGTKKEGFGPDLTHVGSRRFLGAATLENNRGNLIEFIARSQTVKPGNRMPSFPDLDEETLDAIATYLESLK
jgi:cytochrome c oxidase subunit 2